MANREAGEKAVVLIKAIEARNAQNVADAEALLALDTDANFSGVDPRDRRSVRREVKQMRRVLMRADSEVREAHVALDEVITGSYVLVPMFGK